MSSLRQKWWTSALPYLHPSGQSYEVTTHRTAVLWSSSFWTAREHNTDPTFSAGNYPPTLEESIPSNAASQNQYVPNLHAQSKWWIQLWKINSWCLCAAASTTVLSTRGAMLHGSKASPAPEIVDAVTCLQHSWSRGPIKAFSKAFF